MLYIKHTRASNVQSEKADRYRPLFYISLHLSIDMVETSFLCTFTDCMKG